MNLLLQIFKKYFHWVVFFLLELLSLGMFFRNNSYQRSVVQSVGLEIQGAVSLQSNAVRQLFLLRKSEELLQIENTRLRAMLRASKVEKVDTTSLYARDSVFRQMYSYIPAAVIYNSVSLKNNYIVLNAGQEDGIKPGMAVISPNCVVGVVKSVSPHFSSVLSLLNSQNVISVRLGSSNYSGSLQWQGENTDLAEVSEIPSHVKVVLGERIITSGYSLIYPPGLEIGCVVRIMSEKGKDFQRLKIRLNQDFRTLDRVYVVRNIYKDEIDTIVKIETTEE